jgi:endonuclease YncB( thermonuclease family)
MHRPDEIVAKLRDADAMLNSGKDLAAVLQAAERNARAATRGLWVDDDAVPPWEWRATDKKGSPDDRH